MTQAMDHHRFEFSIPRYLAALIAGAALLTSSSRPVSAQSLPDPQVLLGHAASVMDALPSVAVTGAVRIRLREHAALHVSGACDASAIPASLRHGAPNAINYLKAREHLQGTLLGKRIDARLAVIGNGSVIEEWEKSARTGHRWENTTNTFGGIFTLDMCVPLFMSRNGEVGPAVGVFRTLGEVTMAGKAAWHVQVRSHPQGQRLTVDWYIDAHSWHVVREVTRANGSQGGAFRSYTYSHFGAPVVIAPPTP